MRARDNSYVLYQGYGGTTKKHNEEDNVKVRSMTPVEWRPVTVRFTGNVNPGLDWDFAPVQNTVSSRDRFIVSLFVTLQKLLLIGTIELFVLFSFVLFSSLFICST